MSTVNEVQRRTTASGRLQAYSLDYRVSTDSPRRPDGSLKLRSNPHTRWQSTLVSDLYNGKDLRSHPWGSEVLLPRYYALNWARLESRSYASFRRKLYQGSASLGVTLGSYKQSREMIVKRFNTLRLYAGAMLGRTLVREAIRDGKRLKPQDVASIHLEIIFGWIPLLQDIHAAATTVIQEAPAYAWVKSSAKTNQSFSSFAPPNGRLWEPGEYTKAEFNLTHSRGAEVVVSNPNVWLAERAGLLNLASVAWDVVPWSFLVNMFLNIGQLVNSITDFAGLDILNGYSIKKARGVATWHVDKHPVYPGRMPGRDLYYACNSKEVITNAVSAPPLSFKVPEANWELAAMAASLFAQKFAPIVKLINPNHRTR